MSREDQNNQLYPESLSRRMCLGMPQTKATADRTSSSFLSPLCPRLSGCSNLHYSKFNRPRGTFQIRAIRRSETDPIMSAHQSITEGWPIDLGHEDVELTAGGLDEISYATRLIPATSFVMRDDIFRRTSGGKTYLPKGEGWRVKIVKHKRSDKLGKGKRTKALLGPGAWSTFPLGRVISW